jgi:hypothetical protein
MNHFLDDMLNLGSAGGFSTQTGERGLKFWAKIFAVTAQKRSDEVFSGQVVSRIHESELLGAIAGSGGGRESTAVLGSDQVEVYFSGDNFSVLVGRDVTRAIRTLPNGYLHQIQLEFDRTILDWFHGKYSGQIPGGGVGVGLQVLEIQLHTEMRIKNLPYRQGSTIFRAHPNYRSGGPWYDYCLLNYDEAGENVLYPAKIGCFYSCPESGEEKVLIQEVCTVSAEQRGKESLIFEHYRMKSTIDRNARRVGRERIHKALFKSVDTGCISYPVFAIEGCSTPGQFERYKKEDFDIITTRPQARDWPKQFLALDKYLSL